MQSHLFFLVFCSILLIGQASAGSYEINGTTYDTTWDGRVIPSSQIVYGSNDDVILVQELIPATAFTVGNDTIYINNNFTSFKREKFKISPIMTFPKSLLASKMVSVNASVGYLVFPYSLSRVKSFISDNEIRMGNWTFRAGQEHIDIYDDNGTQNILPKSAYTFRIINDEIRLYFLKSEANKLQGNITFEMNSWTINGSTTPAWLNTSIDNITTEICSGNRELSNIFTYVSEWSGNGCLQDQNQTSLNDGVLVNAVYNVSQDAIYFDGSGDYVNIPTTNTTGYLDSPNVRLITHNGSIYSPGGIGAKDPQVIKNGSTYYLFYTSAVGGQGIGMATSTDLDSFIYLKEAISIPDAGWNAWADQLYNESGTYYLLFSSSNNSNYIVNSKIYISNSTNLVNWSTPTVLFNISGTGVFDSFLLKNSTHYNLFYVAYTGSNSDIYLATSSTINGTYTTFGEHVITKTNNDISGLIEAPFIINSSGTYYMYYGVGSSNLNQQIKYSKSTDLVTWSQQGTIDYDLKQSGYSKGRGTVCAPSVMMENGTANIFFCGTSDGSTFSIFRGVDIGYGTDNNNYTRSIEAEIYPYSWSGGNQVIITKGSSLNRELDFAFDKNSGQNLAIIYYSNNGWHEIIDTSGVSYNNYRWYKVAATINSSTGKVKFYRDGVLLSSISYTTRFLPNRYTARIGGSDWSSPEDFNGLIRKVKVSNTEINYSLPQKHSSGHIKAWYNSSPNEIYQIDANGTNQTNSNVSLQYVQNGSSPSGFVSPENTSLNTSWSLSPRFTNTDIYLWLFGNGTSTPQVSNITFHDQAVSGGADDTPIVNPFVAVGVAAMGAAISIAVYNMYRRRGRPTMMFIPGFL